MCVGWGGRVAGIGVKLSITATTTTTSAEIIVGIRRELPEVGGRRASFMLLASVVMLERVAAVIKHQLGFM